MRNKQGFSALVLAALAVPCFAQVPVMLPEFTVDPGSELVQGDNLARDASGRFVKVWNEVEYNQNFDWRASVWAQRFDANGLPLSDGFQVGSWSPWDSSYPGGPLPPLVASDPSGNYVVAWTPPSGGWPDSKVMARRFDNNGAALGDEFRVNVWPGGYRFVTGMAMSSSGFVVVWQGNGASGPGSFGRLYDALGNPVTSDLPFGDDSVGPAAAMSPSGDFVAVWRQEGSPGIVMGRRYAPAGTPYGPAFSISDPATDAWFPRVSSDFAGNFLVTWTSHSGPGEPDVSGRCYDRDGLSVSAEFRVNEFADGVPLGSRPFLDDDGSFVIVWSTHVELKARQSGVRAAPEILLGPVFGLGDRYPEAGTGVFEPGETRIVRTAWVNDTAGEVTVSGTASTFTGPAGADYTLDDGTADYAAISSGQTAACTDCYAVTVSAPAIRPAQHWDTLLQENLNVGIPKTWNLHIGSSFVDVRTDNLFYKSIETVFHNGVGSPCDVGIYCPDLPVTRAWMAIFLLRSKYGSAHVPPPCTGTVFADVDCTELFDPWIEELSGLGITGGCGGGNYCPDNLVTRQQVAVFLLKTLEGSAYLPQACAGIFDDVPCTPGIGFPDWIEELADRGVTAGCSLAPRRYCPGNPNSRGQMAAFLTKTFNLVLYGGR